MSASSIDGPLDSSCVCSTSVASVEKSENVVSNVSTSAVPPDSTGIERARADERRASARPSSRRRRAPCRRAPDACRRARRPRVTRSVRSQLSPASSRAARPDATSAASTDAREENGVRARLLDERRERVDARLRKRRRELWRLARVDLRRAERAGAGRELGRALAEHDARRLAERRRLREHAEPALLELAAVVLEEHERLHRSFLSTTRSRIFCAAEPSSSIFTWPPRDGGGPRSSTVVFAPASPAEPASTPTIGRATASPAASSSRP